MVAFREKLISMKTPKKKPSGKPFVRGGDPRRQEGRCTNNDELSRRVRDPKSVYDECERQLGRVPPGASLRPFNDSDPRCKTTVEDNSLGDSENWIVDNEKLLQALNHAMQLHRTKNRTKHAPKWKQHSIKRVGFGVKVSLKCGFRACKFVSPSYDMFVTGPNGQPLPNMQIGVAMAKTDITPKTVEAVSTTLNLSPPNLTTLHRSFSAALRVAEGLSEMALSENREEVTTTLRLRGEVVPGEIPAADVAIDGQYSNRSYHFPTGKSDSVSVPCVEQVTGKGLLIQHINLGHRDGSLPPNIHINSGETLAARVSYEKTHETPDFPLHFGVVTTDGDTGLLKAMEAGRSGVGEQRPLKRRNCVFHTESAAKRKFNRESLTKLTPAQKEELGKTTAPLNSDVGPNQCPACMRTFVSGKGLTIHRRSCKGERAIELSIKGLEPLFFQWSKDDSQPKMTVKDKKQWRDGIRRWVLKRTKQELNLGLHAANPANISLANDGDIHEALFLGGRTIIPCLTGNHDKCLTDARGCQGFAGPGDYDLLPSKAPLGPIPSQSESWLVSVVDVLLSREALATIVVNGKKATTSLVESVHKEIRLPVPKGRVYRKNEARLIKSGTKGFIQLILELKGLRFF